MAWQPEVGSGSNRATGYRDLATKMVAMMSSQHVATVAVNSGGTGYVVGDIVTLTHAGAYLDARFEVTSVSAGVITGLRINSSGAFSNRIATVAVNAGGTGYAVNDILEVQGGTAREQGKAKVTSVSSGVVTGVALFETGGAYSTAPGLTGASTVGIGPAAFAGDDACTLDLTMTGLVGTTGLSVTGGTGSGATVDITLAQTGWTVDGRNLNNRTVNSLTDEKEIVLVGDATGKTNKPYVGIITWTATSGINTRYGLALFGMTAHNSATAFHLQPGISFGINTSTGALQDGTHLLCDEDAAQSMDFWFSVDDLRIAGVINLNSAAANTDNGEYMHFHMGLMNAYGTETENPYPMLIGASSRTMNIDPSASSQLISGLPEALSATGVSAPWWYYEVESSSWESATNSQNLTASARARITYPFGDLSRLNSSTDPDYIVAECVLEVFADWSNVTRSAPTRKLYPIPGTTDYPFLWPVNLITRTGGSTSNNIQDVPRGEVRGWFWLTATNSAGNRITNFSEYYVTIGSDRYRVFHNHVHIERYQYMALKEDV